MSTDWPPSLTLEPEPVLKLFTGENFYSSVDAAIREVVLNSIDAIGRRSESEPTISPSIEVLFDRDNQTITVTDNGDGMNKEDVANLFTKVGASAAQLTNESNYRAVGEFGIGALSYFLVCEKYEIDTCKDGNDPLALEFSRTMLDGRTSSHVIQPNRSTTGTTVTMHVESQAMLEQCIKQFEYWMRSVDGLSGLVIPENRILVQGGLTRKVRAIDLDDAPEWVDDTELGPPHDLDVWDRYDGKGQIDVLYRGVFVERIEIPQLWGLEGAIHVDPKHFRPMLNREGFVGDKLRQEVTPFLQLVHPLVLEKAVECIHDLLAAKDDWSQSKAIALWLAVPRGATYANAAQAWDKEFRTRKAFRLLESTTERTVSIIDVINLEAEKIYLAPDQINQAMPIVGQAVRVLRGRGSKIVQGHQRDQNYLATVSMPSQFSSWLLLNTFKDELPPIVQIATVAEELVRQESLANIYSTAPVVKVVDLGAESVPFLAVGEEIWINIEIDAGKEILAEICKRNEGHLGLWVACMMHAPSEGRLDQVGTLLGRLKPPVERLGLVKRQYLRSFLK